MLSKVPLADAGRRPVHRALEPGRKASSTGLPCRRPARNQGLAAHPNLRARLAVARRTWLFHWRHVKPRGDVETRVPNPRSDPGDYHGPPRPVLGAPRIRQDTLAQQSPSACGGRRARTLLGRSRTRDKLLRPGRSLRFFDPEQVSTASTLGACRTCPRRDGRRRGRGHVDGPKLGAAVVLDGFNARPLLGDRTARLAFASSTTGTKIGLPARPRWAAGGRLARPGVLAGRGVADVLVALHLKRGADGIGTAQVRKRRGAQPAGPIRTPVGPDGIGSGAAGPGYSPPGAWSTRRAVPQAADRRAAAAASPRAR